mgnify:CR=1 FL=1
MLILKPLDLITKHTIRLKNTLRRNLKMLSLKLQYGQRFQAEKFHFRKGFYVSVGKTGLLKIGKDVFLTTIVQSRRTRKLRLEMIVALAKM